MALFTSSSPSRTKLHIHHSFSESLMEENIETAENIIGKWTSLEHRQSPSSVSSSSSYCSLSSLFSTSNREEAKQYIASVNSLQNSMRRLIALNPGSEIMVRAQSLMQVAMKHLGKEFYRILKSNRQYLDPESVSVRSSRASSSSTSPTGTSRSVSEFSESDDEFESSDFDELKSVGEREKGADADADAMVDLKMIADCMMSSGYGKECVKVYNKIRTSVICEALIFSGFERLTFSQIQKMGWEVLERKIKKWLRAVKFAVRTLFYGERILCDYVFSSSSSVRESCFAEITRESALSLFSFPENVAKCRKSPEKIFRTLDLYEVITDLFPEIESIFCYDSTTAVRSQVAESLAKLGDAVRSMMAEFESSISKEPSKSPQPGGGVHHLARYVMNFIAFLADYSGSLAVILENSSSAAPSLLPEAYFPGGGLSGEDPSDAIYSSPVTVKLAWLILILLCKVDGKAQTYNDAALSYLFLANNLQYVVVKVRTSNLKLLFGDDWVARHEVKVKYFVARYEKLAWGGVLTSFPAIPAADITQDEAEDCFRRFNAAFQEAYEKQSSWVVPDPKLRDEIKVSVARKLVPVYQEFYGKYRVGLLENTREESIIRFAPEDLGNYLSDLFFGTGSSGSISSLSSKSDPSGYGR